MLLNRDAHHGQIPGVEGLNGIDLVHHILARRHDLHLHVRLLADVVHLVEHDVAVLSRAQEEKVVLGGRLQGDAVLPVAKVGILPGRARGVLQPTFLKRGSHVLVTTNAFINAFICVRGLLWFVLLLIVSGAFFESVLPLGCSGRRLIVRS